MKKQIYFVYIVECADQTFYTGIAKDVEKRLHAHNHLKAGARYTSTRRPVTLRYSEKHKDFKSAILREIEIKRWPRTRKQKLFGIKKSGKKVPVKKAAEVRRSKSNS
ncbi:MAG: GIY-YIG nuclease family protein [Candidatus Saccharibacteria bacterium]